MWLSVAFSSFEELKDFELGELLPVFYCGLLKVGLCWGRSIIAFPLLILECLFCDSDLARDTGVNLYCERLLWTVNLGFILVILCFLSVLSVTLSRSLIGFVGTFAFVGVGA